MSRVAVISDIHGNLQALLAVLGALDELAVDEVVCLGDIVGYGPNPRECLELVAQRCQSIVRGNHDEGVLDRASLADFNGLARTALLWTRSVLASDHLEIIRRWPLRAHLRGAAMCVHDSPQPGTAAYVHDARASALAFRGLESAVCLLGHTHVPVAFETEVLFPDEPVTARQVRQRSLRDGDVVVLDAGCRYILNPGAVGQPRDADPRASFAVLDLGRGTFTLHRREYDIAGAQLAMQRAGLPLLLAERLAVGA
jgi:predicted phosphodiesterase